MKNKIFISLLTLLVMSSLSLSYAAEQASAVKTSEGVYQCVKAPCLHNKEFKGVPNGHKMVPPPNKADFEAKRAEFAAKKAEFEKRLNLTEEQKAQIAANKAKDREKMRPIMEQIRSKHQQFAKINADTSLSAEVKEKKKQELKKEIKALKLQADNLRKENMKNFECTLTAKQKKEFEKIKKEQKQEMEKRHKEMEKKMKEAKEIGLPVMPPPPRYDR